MPEDLRYTTFDTNFGWVAVLASARGLLRIILPQDLLQDARELLGERINHATWSPHDFEDLMGRLRSYFKGHRMDFPDKLDLSGTTTFQRKVWEATRLIPYGETRSYSWVASQIGKPSAVRAVGQTLGRNPLPIIIPCHRVLGSDGKLCGFRGGLQMKRYLLSLEA